MDHYANYPQQDAMFDYGPGFPPNDPRAHSYPPFLQNPHPHPQQQLDPSHHQSQPLHQHQQYPSQSWSTTELGAIKYETMTRQHHHEQLAQQQEEDFKSYIAATSNQQQPQQIQQQPQVQSRPSSNHDTQPVTLQTSGLDLDYANMLRGDWPYQLQQHPTHQQQQQYIMQDNNAMTMNINPYNSASFGAHLQASPVEFMPAGAMDNFPVTSAMDGATFMTMAGPMDSMNAMFNPLNDFHNDLNFQMNMNAGIHRHSVSSHSNNSGSSPTGSILEVQSVSDNEGSWSIVNFNPNRASLDSFGTVSNPSQNLHIRTHSETSSDGPHSELSGSWEEVAPWPTHSPHALHGQDFLDAHYLATHGAQLQELHDHCDHHRVTPESSSSEDSPSTGNAHSYHSSGSSTTSPNSTGITSPPLRRRKSPLEGKTTKSVIKKSPTGRKDGPAEKKVGRRRGPLRPDQRQQAHEIRKLRACLRCKFLKKTCDKGEPCGGCRPSHARLWMVPCTRMDIKDIGYFMKDWKADYERHFSLGFSVGNIKGFSTIERTLYITHGYGHYLPITAREVFVRDDSCFGIDWVETTRSVNPVEFDVGTAKLSAGMEGVSTTLLSEYLDRHLDTGFEKFVDDYFDGTKFLTEILKTAYRYYQKEKTPSIRKALKLVLAYNLTMHVTMIEGLTEEEQFKGRINDPKSKWSGSTVAPVMINFQVKCALADMWRELQSDILVELSSLYQSVYSGEKLKHWPTIFMLAAILLAIWEEMQFDCHYRVPDEQAVNKFCDDMETTPVGVIVGLFQAISTKLPALQEWDTKKHHHLLNSNVAVCDALTEVKGHVNKYETYLKDRSNAKFNPDDFDCLTNKFLSKLVIRAN
ncbi:unnamed protein product [Zymoseptoria tritici ST99CH_1A5]|uniref:Zn(2)-C6 fungal-type domain-containing protein n=3 Tax=Zymoseptoria tritici TaxID=1047171 RepID=A0A1X7RMR3_ZYMT9|nr:unnamed protein product [Zymoseptoria tritici ST99CH_3D7]SMR48553.1 unnamed protein product [Zymoseptoria tritici ST99CH_1E4]SMR49734.1 unnamed protein product [Zymoseptoria tritici ST99CH_3D1]SMY22432.1 unnamed protein product [Zymoseptoria tritici ST99CH_1A5]